MLGFVRTHAQSWLIKSILWMVVAAFMGTIFYSWGMGGAQNESTVVATVNGEIITLSEFRKSYLQMLEFVKKQTKENLDSRMTQTIRERALDNLIRRRLLSEKAEEEGLITTDSEVRDQIRAMQFFQVDGVFKEDIYLNFLNNNGLLPKNFEEDMRVDILADKMGTLVKGAVRVSDRETRDFFNKMEERIEIDYLVLTGEQFKDKITSKEEDIKKFFEENKEKFRIPEKRSADYIFASADDLSSKAGVADDEIEDFYYDHIKEFRTPKEIRARHILMKFPAAGGDGTVSTEAEEKTREKAESLLKQVKDGEDFAELAKKHSDDKASATQGGDLGFFRRGRMVPSFEEAAFSLKAGEASGLVRSKFGYHIIKVEDIHEEKTETIEEVKADLTERIRKKKGMRRTKRLLEKLRNEMENQSSGLENIAQQFETDIKQTGLFSRLDNKLEGLEQPRMIIGEVFTLKESELSYPVAGKGGHYLFRIKEILPSSIPPLEEVEKEVRASYVKEAAGKLCGEEVGKLQAALAGGKGLEEIGKEFDLKAQNSGSLNQILMTQKFRLGPEEAENIFQKTPGDAGTFSIRDRHYLYTITNKEKPDEPKFSEEKEKYMNAILEGKKEAIFTAWLENLKNGAEIEINRSQIN